MAEFSRSSLARLSTCHPNLQKIANELIKECDFVVLCGHRDKAAQEAAFRAGNTRKHWPNSNHNTLPSVAMDIAPFPIDWKDLKRFDVMLNAAQRIAAALGIKIRLGRDFPHLKDYPHIELR